MGGDDALRDALDRDGHSVAMCADALDALLPDQMPPDSADVVLIDFAASGASSAEVCKALAARGTAVLAIVAPGYRRVATALDAGAADCLVRPFRDAELQARVRAVGRRLTRHGTTVRLDIGELDLCPARFEVRYRGRLVRLSPTEFRILHYLAVRAGRVVPAGDLVRAIWGAGETNAELVRVNLYRLRQKLETDPRRPQLLRSVPGPGLLLDVPRVAS